MKAAGLSGASANVTRSAWLDTAYLAIRRDLIPAAPELERVTLAWSYTRHAAGHRIGECHHLADERIAILIDPSQWDDPVQLLAILAHETAHAALPATEGHGWRFRRLVRAAGLVGPARTTSAGVPFARWARRFVEHMGYPEAPPMPPRHARGHQPTRMRLYHCQCDPPVKIRAARDDLEALCQECGALWELVVPVAHGRGPR